MKKAAFHNLGCKVNSYELDIMRQILRDEGFEEVPFQDKADIYVVNTCTVTNIADRKSRQMLHRAKKTNPDAVVVAVGCYVETDPAGVEKDDAIDLVIGNNRKTRIGEVLTAFLKEKDLGAGKAPAEQEETQGAAGGENLSGGKELTSEKKLSPGKPVLREDLNCAPAYEDMQLTQPGHTRAYIKIQDGCNQFCSYCIIPYARGRIRSRAKEEVLREVAGLVRGGIREIVLTGIHISSYGLDRDAEGPVRFDPVKAGRALLDLFTDLNAMEGLERIRLGSLEPRIMTESFIAGIAGLKKICPHFHLSLQSGCDETLRRMNRHYTTAEYARSVDLLRRYYDRPAITTDVIVGFPGETEEEFEKTCAFLEKIRFYEIHVFRYSRRNGTVAARMKDQIPESVKALRSDRLLALTAAQAEAYRMQFAGGPETLLLEEICEHEGRSYWTGSTTRYVTGAVPADRPLTGKTGETPVEGQEPLPGKAQEKDTLTQGMLLEGTFGKETIRFSKGDALVFRAPVIARKEC